MKTAAKVNFQERKTAGILPRFLIHSVSARNNFWLVLTWSSFRTLKAISDKEDLVQMEF